MADYYRKIVNTLLITGAEKRAQREQVYEKARIQAQEDIKQASSNEKAAEISAAVEDAIRRAELRFAAEEKNKAAAAAMPVVRIINYKAIAKKTSALILIVLVIAVTAGIFYSNPTYLTQVKDLASSYLVPTIPTDNRTPPKSNNLPPEQSAKTEKPLISNNDSNNINEELSDLNTTIKTEAVVEQTTLTKEIPQAKKQSTVTQKNNHIQPSKIVSSDDNILNYEAIKQCAQDYLLIDQQWEKLNSANDRMQKKSAEITNLNQQKEHHLIIASAQAEYNKLVQNYNTMVDTLNANSVKLNNRCADKSINYDDLGRICQKGSPYSQSSFCTSMM